jgi:hypothetical protein
MGSPSSRPAESLPGTEELNHMEFIITIVIIVLAIIGLLALLRRA